MRNAWRLLGADCGHRKTLVATGHRPHSAKRKAVLGIREHLRKIQASHRVEGGRTQGSAMGLSYGIATQGCRSSSIPQADPTPTEARTPVRTRKRGRYVLGASMPGHPAHRSFLPFGISPFAQDRQDSKSFALAKDHRTSNPLCLPAWFLTLAWRCRSPVGVLLMSV